MSGEWRRGASDEVTRGLLSVFVGRSDGWRGSLGLTDVMLPRDPRARGRLEWEDDPWRRLGAPWADTWQLG